MLAAGRSSRMGDVNKLTLDIHGIPLIRRVATAICESDVNGLSVICGHEADDIAKALEGINARFLFNPDYASGQASSIRTGLHNLPQIATDMMVFLGDMPFVSSDMINKLVKNHLARQDREMKITLPMVRNKRGNPVIWGQAFFEDIKSLSGDIGARQLFQSHKTAMNIVTFDEDHLCLDADTKDDLKHIIEIFPTRHS